MEYLIDLSEGALANGVDEVEGVLAESLVDAVFEVCNVLVVVLVHCVHWFIFFNFDLKV
jgi:hypothetical protein